MVQDKEDMKGDEGFIRVGATGIVSDLMKQELDSMKRKSHITTPSTRRKLQTVPVSISCGVSSAKRLQTKRGSSHNTSNGGCVSSVNYRRTEGAQRKTRSNQHSCRSIPMLKSEDVFMGRTPDRSKPKNKGLQIVEVVDLKCGSSSVRSSSTPISNQLKKLSFERLSD